MSAPADEPRGVSAADRDACLEVLRAADRDRYLACLLVPETHRGALAALYAFNAEVARVRDIVREPLPGEIRLQWWRDALTGEAHGSPRANPIARALLSTIETHALPTAAFDRLIEARLFDLYDDPMPDRTAFEGYAGETTAALIQLSALVCAGASGGRSASEAAGHAGVALAVAGALLLMPQHRARGQVFLPGDILAATGLTRESFLSGEDRLRIGHAVEAFAALGREHLGRARAALPAMDPHAFPAFLPAALAAPVLERAVRLRARVANGDLRPPQWRRQWWLWRAARRQNL